VAHRMPAEVTNFKQICDKEEESGIRKSGRRTPGNVGWGAGGEAIAREVVEAAQAPLPSLNSAGVYVPVSKKKALAAMVLKTRGLPSRAVGRGVCVCVCVCARACTRARASEECRHVRAASVVRCWTHGHAHGPATR